MNIRQFNCFLGAAFLFWSAAACSNDEQAAADPAVAARAASALSAAAADAETAAQAERVLAEKCVRDQGFKISPPLPEAVPDDPSLPAVSPDLEDAKRAGYGLSVPEIAVPPSTGPSSWDETSQDYKDRYQLALFGSQEDRISVILEDGGELSTTAGGCWSEVRKAMYGDLQEYSRLQWVASQAKLAADGPTTTNPTWRGASAAWLECMESRNYEGLENPFDARDLATTRYSELGGEGKVSAAEAKQLKEYEISIAVDDAECADETNLHDAWDQAALEGATQYLGTHEADMLAWKSMVEGAAKKARDLLDAK